jgi:hypothetical protein
MQPLTLLRRALTPLLMLTAAAGCGGGSDGTGPNDDEVFGTYTLVRAAGQSVPLAKVFEADLGFGALIGTYVESGSFRLSENGTWAFSFHFIQIGVSSDPDLEDEVIEYDVDDTGTYSLQNGTITLDGSVTASLVDGVLIYSVNYDAVPNVPPTTVHYEFEK